MTLTFSKNGGADWSPVPRGSALDAFVGELVWSLIGLGNGDTYRVRITCDQTPGVTDESGDFSIAGLYYVNDSSTDGDAYCTAPGDDANDGLSPALPKATVQDVIADYALQPNDTVVVDVGAYQLADNIAVSYVDSGTSSGQVRFLGVPGKTVLDRGNPGGDTSCFYISGDYVTVENMTCRNAYYGIRIDGGEYGRVSYNRIVNCRISDCGGYGVYSFKPKSLALSRNVVVHAGSESAVCYKGYPAWGTYEAATGSIVGNTIVCDDATGVAIYSFSGPSLCSNIIRVSGTGRGCIYNYTLNGIPSSDYNALWPVNGAVIGYLGATGATVLGEWQVLAGWDAQSISLDPQFAGPAARDYHLKSYAGRWDPGAEAWVYTDTEISPCIDAGDPDDSVGEEALPNGDLVNSGAYGGTAEASKSPSSGRWLVFDGAGDRQPLHAWEPLRWTARGGNWSPAETVRLEYSDDSGAAWHAIAGAESRPYDALGHWWDTRTVPDGDQYRFRVESNTGDPIADSDDRDYTILNSEGVEFTLNTGWNLVSIPLEPDDPARASVFPNPPCVAVWQYGNPGGYAIPDEVHPKHGCWVKATEPTTIRIAGTRPADRSVAVKTGWNLVGACGPGAGETSVPRPPNPPVAAIWEYLNPGGYGIPTVCEDGHGFWIKATEDTTIWSGGP